MIISGFGIYSAIETEACELHTLLSNGTSAYTQQKAIKKIPQKNYHRFPVHDENREKFVL